MDNFWTWLKRANAKAVLGVAVVALVAVAGWWTWKAFRPVAFAPLAVHPVPPPKAAPPLGLLTYLTRESQSENHLAATNLFGLPTFLKPKPEPTPIKPDTTAVKPEPKQEPTPKQEPVPKSEPPKPKSTPPKKDAVTLTYRGLYQPSAGPTLVLIEDSNSKQSTYYPLGTNILGWTIGPATMEELSLTSTNAAVETLLRGTPAPFENGKRLD